MSDFLKYSLKQLQCIQGHTRNTKKSCTAKSRRLNCVTFQLQHSIKNSSSRQIQCKCEDMEIAGERLICFDATNSDKYLKVLEDINKERESILCPLASNSYLLHRCCALRRGSVWGVGGSQNNMSHVISKTCQKWDMIDSSATGRR